MVPDDDQAMVLPWASVMVIIVLLKEALTCATPEVMFLRSRRRGLARPPAGCCSLAIQLGLLVGSVDAEAGLQPAGAMGRLRRLPSSCRRSALPCLCACARWYGCAGL